ncbi:response regulator [Flavobacterium ajazii]|uniref:response regulator n=1 Tax=Flavobacterium ajazii TaxID=2692318 RepID=UPI0013D6AE4B|nr:response regulator [Flavobacterium ajazii]
MNLTHHTSVKNTHRSYEKQIKILNIFCIVWMCVVLFIICMNLYMDVVPLYFEKKIFTHQYINWDIFFGHSVCEILVLTVYFLNRKKKFKLARVLFMIFVFAHFNLFTLFVNPGRFIEYYFCFFAGIALPFFRKNTLPFAFMILSYICFLCPYYVYVVYPQDIIDRLMEISTFCLFLSVFLLMTYFKKLNLQNETLLEIERDKVIEDKNIIAQKESELRELNEFKTQFFINLSHEIRTPLTLIQGYVSRIDFDESQSENQNRIAVINSQTAHIQNIIDNILDLSKIDSNEFKINTAQVPLIPFLNKHYQEFKELFDKKQIHFSLQLEIPTLEVQMDESLISKSINNLLANALKFTPEKGKVQMKAILNTDLQISIEDSGIGIPEADLTKVFDRFYQSKNDITKSQGNGIGLSFTKSIIEKHQFSIDLTSEPSVSTVFTITIPEKFVSVSTTKNRLEVNNDNKRTDTKTAAVSTYNSPVRKRILLVEDHQEMQTYIQMVLHQFEVVQAFNGSEALQILKNQTFDIIITDYMMPVLDGESLVRELKNQNNKTPIIVLTARADQQGKLNMLRLGVDAYLNKPFVEEELLLLIQKSLESAEVINAVSPTLNKEEQQWLEEFSQKFNADLNDYIHANLTQVNFGVEELASRFSMSKSTLNRKTKAVLGQTPQEIITEARLQKAKALLKENPYATKKEIAGAVGINNSGYLFSKLKIRFAIE